MRPLALLRIAFHIVVGMASIAVLFPWSDDARRQRIVRWWARRLLALAGIRVRVSGPRGVAVHDRAPARSSVAQQIEDAMRIGGRGALLVLNHVSWADVFVVDTVRPARFVAKSEIGRWPLIGFLTRRTGTIFIERGRRHAVREANHRIVELLRKGDLIAMFPEGTTGDGDRLLPFHANLLQPAIDAGVPIVVAGLRYVDRRGRPTIATSYAGDLNLMQSLLRILREGPFVCELHVIDAFAGEGLSRHDVARRARAVIARRLGFDDEADETSEALAGVALPAGATATAPARPPGHSTANSGGLRRAAAPDDRELESALDPRDELL